MCALTGLVYSRLLGSVRIDLENFPMLFPATHAALMLPLLVLSTETACAGSNGKYPPMSPSRVPKEIRPFIEAGTRVIVIKRADLNRDGRKDVLLVLEETDAADPDDAFADRKRPLLILTRDASGTLRLRKRNDKTVMCSVCGGLMGDPLMLVSAKSGSLRIEHFGGSGWRGMVNYQFDYSQRDDTWQLAQVEQSTFHIDKPDEVETTIRVPPRHFGNIDLADFDPNKLPPRD